MKLTSRKESDDQSVKFSDVKSWYERNLHPDIINLDDSRVYEHVYCAGKWGGVFQFTASGAQKFCVKAQPKNIIDIAAITSIYRPGPLVAGVDRDYVAAKSDPDNVVYDHKLIKQVLGKTFGFLVFQEQMLQLGHVVGKMPLAKCDRLRKVITKRSVSGKDKAQAESEQLGDEFVKGAIENGFSEQKALQLWNNMAAFKGYAFNLSHALSYAIDSYMCAWLLTYFEPEWLCAYMETQDGQPEKRAEAIAELKSFGYEISKIDINKATGEWSIQEGKKFMPAFSTVKGLGDAAVEELLRERPYTNIENLLWKNDGSWKHSKFNKRSLEALIKLRAFDSMNIVDTRTEKNRTFRSYKHMWRTLIHAHDGECSGEKCKIDAGGTNELKHKKKGKATLEERIKQCACDEWSNAELNEMSKLLSGSADLQLSISSVMRDKIENQLNIKSIDNYDKKWLYWFIVETAEIKQTKGNKSYCLLTVSGTGGKRYRIYVWGFNSQKDGDPAVDGNLKFNKSMINRAFVGEIEKSNFGFSAQSFRVKPVVNHV